MKEYEMTPPKFEMAPLGLKFRLLHEQFKCKTNEEIQQYDLTYSQMWVLWYLLEHPGERIRQKDLCKAARVKHPTMVGLLQRMEAKGLVVLEADPGDRRQSLVHLTDKAEQIMEAHRLERDERDRRLVDGMTADEVAELDRLLGIVYHNIDYAQKGTNE